MDAYIPREKVAVLVFNSYNTYMKVFMETAVKPYDENKQ
jgi:hypothetical protein